MFWISSSNTMRALARPIGVARSVAALWEHILYAAPQHVHPQPVPHIIAPTQCPQQLDADATAEAAESKAATAKDEETAMENAIKVSFSK